MNERRTKIICTIGPSSSTRDVIYAMIKEGMNVARLNFSHGTYDVHKKTIDLIRSVSNELDIPLCIMQDLQGPKIRIQQLENNRAVKLKEGEYITITTENIVGNEKKVSTSYKCLVKDVNVGGTILIDDGLLNLKVVEKNVAQKEGEYDHVKCKIIVGGMLGEHKGINLPGTKISQPALTEKDIKDLEFGLANDVDCISLSFVRQKQDILDGKEWIRKFGHDCVPIIAKIERAEAIENIEEILSLADGMMVARGDLGVELPYYELPILQKRLIKKSSVLGKLDITATQMLASMVDNPIPTRAEVSDVANAIFDGTDVIMMSNETATGKYPVESVKVMSAIAKNADMNATEFSRLPTHVDDFEFCTEKISESTAVAAAIIAAKYNSVKIIACVTRSGHTAIQLSQYRPRQWIVALTSNEKTYNRLAMAWGVYPIRMEFQEKNLEKYSLQTLKNKGMIKIGDVIVLVMGTGEKSGSNTIRLIRIEEEC